MHTPRLLLIENDPAHQTLLFEILNHAGYTVHVAAPDDYLDQAQTIKPNILLLGCDDHARSTDAWTIAATLREVFPRLALIMLSTNPVAVHEVGRTPRGQLFDAGLRKPVHADTLLRTLARCYR